MPTRSDAARNAEDAVRPAPDPALTADDLVKGAEDLVPLLRERAVATDRDRQVEADTYRRLGDAGFFHILKPKRYGRFTFASTAVGAAWGAAEHFAASLTSATRVANALGGAVRLADQDYVATEFAEAAGEVQMAMALIERRSLEASERARQHRSPSPADLALEQRDNALVTRVALRSVQRLYSLVGSKAGNPEHPVSLAKRDIEMVSHHVTLNWRQSAVLYLAAATQSQPGS
jgi:alkylation response protein AidB-like acyl-CoA dehydrogenase